MSDRVYIIKEGECLIRHKVDSRLFENFRDNEILPTASKKYKDNLKMFEDATLKNKCIIKQLDVSIGYIGDLIGFLSLFDHFFYIVTDQVDVLAYFFKHLFLVGISVFCEPGCF